MKRLLDQLKTKVADTELYLLDDEHSLISSSLHYEDIPDETSNIEFILHDSLMSNSKNIPKYITIIGENQIWRFQPIILNGAENSFCSTSKKASEIIIPSNWYMVLEIPLRMIALYFAPFSDSLMTFHAKSIIVF